MSNILDFLKSDIGQAITSICLSLIGALLICFFKWISNKTKNKRLKRLLLFASQAIEMAESVGGTSSEKLSTAVSFLQSKVPKSKILDCEKVIEMAIDCTKTNVNRKQEQRSSSSIMTTRS